MDVTLIDPGPNELEWLLEQGFDVQLRMGELPPPSFIELRSHPLAADDLQGLSEEELWALHVLEMASWGRRSRPSAVSSTSAAQRPSLLHLKSELAHRQLQRCGLCAWSCDSDRTRGERGRCGLGTRAQPVEPAVHVGEEALFNPTLLVSMRGCGLRCRFCQQSQLLRGGAEGQIDLRGATLSPHHREMARSWSFIGGNPDESLPSVLDALLSVPAEEAMPIVWNTHGWVPSSTSALLEGLVDVYVTDVKFGNDRCAEALACVPRYTDTVHATIRRQAATGARLVVRLLALPGHHGCCVGPALDRLADLGAPQLEVSFEARYTPSHLCSDARDPLGGPLSEAELTAARSHAQGLGLAVSEPGLRVGIPSERGGHDVVVFEEDSTEERS